MWLLETLVEEIAEFGDHAAVGYKQTYVYNRWACVMVDDSKTEQKDVVKKN